MAATRRLTQLVEEARNRLRLPDGGLTVALSGGADSAALAFLVTGSGRDLGAVHVDHGFPASPMLRDAAARIAEHLGIDMETVEVELGPGPSPEGEARDARYRVFDVGQALVLTAHTRDDSVETILLNLVRGTGVVGLVGIPYHRPPSVYRPLLEVSRAETREIATLAGLPFEDDPMNRDSALARNRLRLRVMPLLRELNPKVEAAIARTSELLGRDAEYLDEVVPGHSADGVPVSSVLTLPRPLADRLLARLLVDAGVGVTSDRLARAWSVARGQADRHELAGGKVVVRRGALLVVE